MAPEAHFNVHVFADARWTLEAALDEETAAVDHAKRALATGRFDAVKVTWEQPRAGGRVASRVVFVTEREKPRKRISARRGAGGRMICRQLEDLLTPAAAAVIGSVLADYLDWRGITPTELLHHHAHAHHLANHASLEQEAIAAVAAAQAEAIGEPVAARRELLEKLWQQAVQRARKTKDGGNVPNLGKESLGEAFNRLDERVEVRIRDYLLRTAISARLTEERGWRGRLEALMGLLEEEPPVGAEDVVDPFVADLLRHPSADEDMIGRCSDLASALAAQARLLAGNAAVAEPAAADERLARLVGSATLPVARAALLERFVGALRSTAALSHGSPVSEIAALYRIAVTLKSGPDARIEPSVQEAIENRSAHQVRAESDRLLQAAAPGRERIAALLDLRDFVFGAEARSVVMVALAGAIDLARAAEDLVDPAEDTMGRLSSLARLQEQVLDFGAETSMTEDSMARLDHEAARIIERERLLDRLESGAADGLAAIGQLAELFRRQALTRGEATEMVRQRALDLMRRPESLEGLRKQGAADRAYTERRVRLLWQDLQDIGMM